jgi:DTW domain-containing protein YfiP
MSEEDIPLADDENFICEYCSKHNEHCICDFVGEHNED